MADVAAMFKVRTSVRGNTLTRDESASLGITPEAIAQSSRSAVDLEDACLFAAFVLPEHEGQGLGRRLVQAAEAALFARHPAAWLETGAASRATGFYRRLGWAFDADAGAATSGW